MRKTTTLALLILTFAFSSTSYADSCKMRDLKKFSIKNANVSEATDYFKCLTEKGAKSAAIPYLIHMVSKSKNPYYQEKNLTFVLDHLPRDYETYLYKKLISKRLRISDELRSDLYYYFALNNFDHGKTRRALKFLSRQSKDKDFAKKTESDFLEAVVLTKMNKINEAKWLFERLARGKFSSPKKDKIVNASKLNLARLLMSENDLKGAIEEYRTVSFRDSEWFDGLVEMSWAMLTKEDNEDAIGNAVFIDKTTQKSIYKPWLPVIKAVGLLKLCQFPEAKKELSEFKKDYNGTLQGLKALIESTPEEKWYRILLSVYETKMNSKNLEKHPALLFYAARNSRLINYQNRINELIEEEEAINKVKRNMKRDSFTYKLMSSKLAKMDTHIKMLETTTGKAFKSILKQNYSEHKKLERIADTLDFEIFSRSSKNITHRIAGEKFQDKMKKTKSKESSWMYIGEFWTDESGRFRSFLKNKCEAREKIVSKR